MSRPTLTICKFVGTISLGLLTGQSLTLSLTLLPTLSTISTSPSAQKTHAHLAALTQRQTALLSTLSGAAFLLAYTLAPPRSRHPYLLYASLAVAGGWAGEVKEYYLSLMGKKSSGSSSSGTSSSSMKYTPTSSPGVGGGTASGAAGGADSSGDEEWDLGVSGVAKSGTMGAAGAQSQSQSQAWNGEAVHEGMERWRKRMGWKSGVWGLGWAMAVVGLWGDGA